MTIEELGAAPREVSKGVKRGAWGEPRVRFWVVIGGALLAAMLYLVGMEVLDWVKEGRLVREGVAVDAVVFEAGAKLKNKPVPALSNVDLTYGYEGQTYHVTGELPERRGLLMNGQTIPIRIDPGDPKIWTNRTEPAGLAGRMVGAMLVLPAVVLAGLGAWVMRGRVIKIWREGEGVRAMVVGVGQTPIAPLSQVVRCVGGGEKRVMTVYVPMKEGKVREGDEVEVVRYKGRAVAVRRFL